MNGIVLPDRPAAKHIRAVYGGMEIGLGMVLMYFCIVKDGVRNGLIVLAFSIGACTLSRLYGIVYDVYLKVTKHYLDNNFNKTVIE